MMMGKIEGAKEVVEAENGWIILRTSAGRTLGLAKSLTEAGIPAWTPSDVRQWRLPRTAKRVERDIPMMPGLVFAVADRLGDVIAITHLPMSPHPAFSVFRWNGSYPMVADRSLDPVRRLEAARKSQRALKEKRKAIPAGTRVRSVSGASEGLIGVVERAGEQFATVQFDGGALPLVIATYLLVEERK